MPSPPADARQSYPLPPELDLSDKNVIVTGGTSGIGLETVKVIARSCQLVAASSNTTWHRQRRLGPRQLMPVCLPQVQTLCLKNARVFMVSGDDEKGQW
jgi:NAD(P)-dependent dehydrogenase (short-subunit alcohol dehydrogenase family)